MRWEAEATMKKWNLREKIWETAAILVCVTALLFGVFQKEGYHMDELLSFELSNARFNPWIVPTQPQGRLAKFVENEIDGESASETMQNLWNTAEDVLKNRGSSRLLSYQADVYEEPVWITREEFAEYITVGDRDAFQYLSVYFNVKDDNHPPLHFMALHTISSLFRGKIEPLMGCAINIAAAVGIMVLLMKLGRMFGQSFGREKEGRLWGILAALFYELSTGAMATTLLIRMYGMLTFFCVAFFYFCFKKWQNREFDKKNFLLIAVTAMGFWTQYFFLFYCILLVLVLIVVLLREKRGRECFCLIRSMMIAGAAGVLVFPFSIGDVLSSGRGTEALDNLAQGFSGFGQRIAAFCGILTERTFGGVWWVLLAMGLMCLCRAACGRHGKAKDTVIEKTGTGRAEKITAVLQLVIPAAGYFLLAARMSPYLVDRYIMPVFPFAVFVGVLIAAKWLEDMSGIWKEKAGNAWRLFVWSVLLLAQLAGLAAYDGSYLYQGYAGQEQFAAEHASLPCICVYEGVGYYENLPEFTHYEKTLLVKTAELSKRKDKESVRSLPEVAVLVKPGADWEQVQAVMEEDYGFVLKETVLSGEGAHGDILTVFERVR